MLFSGCHGGLSYSNPRTTSYWKILKLLGYCVVRRASESVATIVIMFSLHSTYNELQSTLLKILMKMKMTIIIIMIRVIARGHFIMVPSQLLNHSNLTERYYSDMYNMMMWIVKILIQKR